MRSGGGEMECVGEGGRGQEELEKGQMEGKLETTKRGREQTRKRKGRGVVIREEEKRGRKEKRGDGRGRGRKTNEP